MMFAKITCMNLNSFTRNGRFLMLAFDHRGSFRKIIDYHKPETVSAETVINLKKEIIEILINQVGGLLVDVDYGLPAYKRLPAEKQTKPYLLAIEKTGYQETAAGRLTELGYSVGQLKEKGAAGIKLLLYFNPRLSTAANQLLTAKRVADDCQQNQLPFFLEIVTYGENLSKSDLILESVKIFLDKSIRPDVFKLEFPGTVQTCQKLTILLNNVPWILLSAGDPFEIFKTKLRQATEGGASGFLAGRALWQEVGQFKNFQDRKNYLINIVIDRFNQISEIVERQSNK